MEWENPEAYYEEMNISKRKNLVYRKFGENNIIISILAKSGSITSAKHGINLVWP